MTPTSNDASWERWYEKLADRMTKERPLLVSFLLPDARSNEFSVQACGKVFAERGYRLENRQDVNSSVLWGRVAVPQHLIRLCFSRIDPAHADERGEPMTARSLGRYRRWCRRMAHWRTRRRPPETMFKVHAGRRQRSRRAIEQKIQLAVYAFVERGYRLHDRRLSGTSIGTVNPFHAMSERPIVTLMFRRVETSESDE